MNCSRNASAFDLISRLEMITKREAPPADSTLIFVLNHSLMTRTSLSYCCFCISIRVDDDLSVSLEERELVWKRKKSEREERNLISLVTSDSHKPSVAISLSSFLPIEERDDRLRLEREKRRSRRPFCSFSDPVAWWAMSSHLISSHSFSEAMQLRYHSHIFLYPVWCSFRIRKWIPSQSR